MTGPQQFTAGVLFTIVVLAVVFVVVVALTAQ